MLEILSKQDALWRKYALQICGCKILADDLVQDMYIELKDNDTKKNKGFHNQTNEISKRYVYTVLRNLNGIRLRKQNPEYPIEEHLNILSTPDNNDTLNKRFECLELLKNECGFFEREVLLITHSTSLRKAEEITDVPHYVLNYHKTKELKRLKAKYGNRAS